MQITKLQTTKKLSNIYLKDIKIESNRQIKGRFYLLVIRDKEIARIARPGQFLHIKDDINRQDPLLRRPFSIYKIENDAIYVLYEVIGKGTNLLRAKRAKDSLSILGPLGSSFSATADKHPLLVGGGIGIAPLLFLATSLLDRGIKSTVILGYRSADDIIGLLDFKSIGIEPLVVTNDGSFGKKGFVTDYLEPKRFTKVFACGPIPMLAQIASLCKDRTVECDVSMHNIMGCGFGVCLGCVFPSKVDGAYSRICSDGPIFNALSLDFDKWAVK